MLVPCVELREIVPSPASRKDVSIGMILYFNETK